MLSAPKAQLLAGPLSFLLLIGTPAPAPSALSFEAARAYPTGIQPFGIAPYAVATGDLNSDGLPDLVTANNASDMTILLGTEDGTFEAKPSVLLFDSVLNVALGHLDGDGALDMAVAMYSSVAVLLGDGKGGFGEPIHYPADGANSVAIGDFNADGFSDLAVPSYLTNSVSLMAGGDGKFESMATLALDGSPYEVAAGDLDGDGRSDLAVVIFESQTASVFRSATGFLVREIYPVGSNPNDVEIADATGDGRLDVVVPCFGSHWVAVLPNDSSGKLKPAARYETGDYPGSVGIADVNHDGVVDLVTTNEFLSRSLSVLLGTGTGSFHAKTDFEVGTVVHGIVIDEFDRDGNADLAAAATGNDLVLVFRGDGAGGFATRKSEGVGLEPRSVAIADMDGDSHLDVVTANDVGNNVTVLLRRGDVWSRTDYVAALGPMAIAVGDLNGDGYPDVVSANWRGRSVSVLLGNGDGTLRPRTNFATIDEPYSLAISDLDGDGKPDLVAGNRSGGGGNVGILLGRGDGTFQPVVHYPTSGPSYGVAVGDVNGDSKPDIATANYNSGVSILRGTGNGAFSLTHVTSMPGFPRGIAMGDLNHDGKQDLITANAPNSTLSVLMGNGTGAFSTVVHYAANYGPTCVATGDLTGDGIMDLAVANTSSTTVSVFPGVGDGTLEPRLDFQASRNPHGVAIGDLDGDGLPDVVSADVIAHTISILRNTGGEDIVVVGVEPRPGSRSLPAPRVFPNPLNPSGALLYRTARPGPVDLRVFDVHGRLIRTLSVPIAATGPHELGIDGRDTSGNPLPSGVYFFALRTADGIARGRFAVLK